MAKIMYFDVETTGLSPVNDSIHQMCGLFEVDGEILDTFNIKMKPKNFYQLPADYVSPVGGITKQMMSGKDYVSQREGYDYLHMLITKYVDRYDKKDKLFICGYNCQNFDVNFLRQLFIDNMNTYYGAYFWSATLDAMILAAEKLIDARPDMKDFKLGTVAEHFGLTVEGVGLHDAMTDINLTRAIYQLCKVL